jgi:hypothetical protein
MCCCHDEKDVWAKERARASGMFCHSEKGTSMRSNGIVQFAPRRRQA